MHPLKGTEVNDEVREFARALDENVPEGISLINVWDISINK